jgi:hypothetical protein
MKKIMIFGAGSLGNHLTNAGLKAGYEIYITDKSDKALNRMKKQLFKKRYGYWSEHINLIKTKEVNKIFDTKFEIIIIGTPPKTHLMLYDFCKKNLNYKKILIEKPLCVYSQKINNFSKNDYTFCGYNHSVSPSIKYFLNLLTQNKINYLFSSIKWKEGWTGILNAHYWLKDEFSSYLGNIEKGGGAIHEHSHPIHLAAIILKSLSNKNIKVENSNLLFKKKKKIKYDYFANILLNSDKNKVNVEIDLIEPGSKKEITIYFKNKIIRWIHNYSDSNDAVIIYYKNKKRLKLFKKKRETEFIEEIKHIKNIKNVKEYLLSPLNVNHGITVMKIIKKVLLNENLLRHRN